MTGSTICISSLQLSAAAFISVTSFGFEMPIISSISSSISAISTPQNCHMLSCIPVKIRVRFDIGFQATRVFLSLVFSTVRHGARLRAFSRLSLFPLPGTGPDYARFLVFSFFHCSAYKVLKLSSAALAVKALCTFIYLQGSQTDTFHYVSISTASAFNMTKAEFNLHSTMYLFKLEYADRQFSRLDIYIPLCIYFNPRIFRSLISIRIVVALLSTKQTSIIFILTCSDNIWISTDKIRIVDPPVILQYYVPTVKAKNSSDLPFYPRILCPTIVAACF